MKKVGIITMHRVPNCGSALQAYATCRAVEEFGFSAEIIDYDYPNAWHLERQRLAGVVGGNVPRQNFFLRLARAAYCRGRAFFSGRSRENKIRENAFEKFYADELPLSRERYPLAENLRRNAPVYDIYMTGSDQVWNPRFAQGDMIFFCDFAPENSTKISYAASFATTDVPAKFAPKFSEELAKYSAISVREKEGVVLVKKLCGKKAELVCDPTLLLDANAWAPLAERSRIAPKKPYLLVYILAYAYNPFPRIYKIVDAIQAQTGLRAVFLFGSDRDGRRPNSSCVNAAGPNEFVRLFRDADFVVTTSFHGTAFSLNFGKPFYSIVESLDAKDSRMLSLLREVGAEDRVIPISADEIHVAEADYAKISPRLTALRERSRNFLANALEMGGGNNIPFPCGNVISFPNTVYFTHSKPAEIDFSAGFVVFGKIESLKIS